MEKVCLIKTSNLKKDFDKKSAVNNLDINVYEGDVYGFLGPNGSGKSTSIKMMLGLVKPTNGKITINGYDIETERERALQKIGAMVETPKFYENLSGYKNLILIANLYGLPKNRVNEVLEMVGMTNAATKKVSAYSLGMKQRLGIARAFLNNPNIVILDEPTNGLDPQGVKDIRNLIKELSTKYSVTFFISSHILSEIQAICNRVAIINNGELIVENYTQGTMKFSLLTPIKKKDFILGKLAFIALYSVVLITFSGGLLAYNLVGNDPNMAILKLLISAGVYIILALVANVVVIKKKDILL